MECREGTLLLPQKTPGGKLHGLGMDCIDVASSLTCSPVTLSPAPMPVVALVTNSVFSGHGVGGALH
jgi:hypothetical protein